MPYKILIVEDDNVIVTRIASQLTRWGYETRAVEDYNRVMEDFLDFSPQLVLMDISLPFYNGYYWCGEIRKVSQAPVVFLSSAGDKMNIVMAMNMGGDDFIAKPFDLEVLSAKLQAILRRTYSYMPQTSLLEHRGVILDQGSASLDYQGRKIELTKNEFRILQILYQNPGAVIPRDNIMKRLWDSDLYVDDNTLTVNIARLRRKLEEAGIEDFILTKKGIGYSLGA